ncbi:uncharacterized protein LOC116259836 isoform X2 [Nymphaea colorata]|uniref:uncharacterized protein LOC116259836 isoform X2 n=1 Tax=Nymphaea colorata TaxID=210225 RepID=UPI00214E746C|nr:uncharacterized protein LOC116259836 isoform X2 [Nymphaea colorata]
MLSLASQSPCSTFGGVPLSPFGNVSTASLFCSVRLQPKISWLPLHIEARERARQVSPKVRNRRLQRKFNGTSRRPRLSVFCSGKQLYAVLVDDQNKKCLFCGSTLQKSMRESHDKGTCSTMEAAKRVGEELVKTCIRQKIHEISSYDRNGFSRGERMKAFEYAVIRHGFIPPWKSDQYSP